MFKFQLYFGLYLMWDLRVQKYSWYYFEQKTVRYSLRSDVGLSALNLSPRKFVKINKPYASKPTSVTPMAKCKSCFTKHITCTRLSTNDNYFLPRYKTKKVQRSLKYQGAKLWNSISNEIKKSTSVKLFKKKITKHSY